jgi:hypothetical protein
LGGLSYTTASTIIVLWYRRNSVNASEKSLDCEKLSLETLFCEEDASIISGWGVKNIAPAEQFHSPQEKYCQRGILPAPGQPLPAAEPLGMVCHPGKNRLAV